ncbi:non-ribosomal peptide synthetase [Pseudarthrobacter sp. PH31-O2]|uniref:non-ribosomal peptide synthetase n=1 Tax=Pseudarthrobacter sp. PH31-O2 TaxID=3046206 RepID=UPI0024BA434B|nr:non-ribosomal peptide synthetase [Pseudarthrobacter sp. PH31-O2]MDJ0352672.1 amino acid adenylation domain-containing protein [Pseudarthrobacter sp. PH31-O2]
MSPNPLNAQPNTSGGRLDLSPAQRGIWYAQRLAPENPMYQIGQFVEIEGTLEVPVLAEALARAVAETDALNVAFGEDHAGPFQLPRSNPAGLDVTDLSGANDPEAQARMLMDSDLGFPRDVITDELLHTELIRISDQRHFFYQRVHHLMLDGYSAVLVLKRVAELYQGLLGGSDGNGAGRDRPRAFGALPELLAAESDYAESATADADRSFWKDQLQGASAATGLAGRPTGTASSLVRATRTLPPTAVAALASATGSAPAQILTTAALYLHRITGEREVSVALPVTARRGQLAKSTPSMLSNILPIRIGVEPGATVRDTVSAMGATLRGALIHQRARFEDLNAQSGYRGPSVNILPVLENISFGPARGTMNILSTGPIDDLSIIIHGLAGGSAPEGGSRGKAAPTVQFEANAALYSTSELQEHLERFVRLLDAVATEPESLLASLSVTTAAEELSLLAAGEAGDADLPGHTIVEEFRLNARESGPRTAVVAPDGELTFGELESRSNQLARFLSSHGAGPGQTVAVRLGRSVLLPVAILAILKSGAAYLPLDPDYPAGRVEGMLEDAAPVRLLTSGAFTGDASEHADLATDVPVTVLDAALMVSCLDGKDASPLPCPAGQQDLAYVIFTSGSTGRPKGVGVEHLALLNLYTSHRESIFAPAEERLGRKLRVAHTAGLSFDASWDPILWLIAGHELHLVDNQTRRDPEALSSYLAGTGIDSIETTPSFAKVLLAGGLFDQAAHPSVVALGGEAVDPPLWSALAEKEGLVAYNFYGPTETTVDSLTAVMSPGTEPTLGDSVANSRHYILDSGLNPVPVNAIGELYVAGINLARGYLDQPGLSAERFVADPFVPDGSRMYRTGDVVRRLPDGTLEFRGRMDAQVKIRGFRIELAEIEEALRGLDGVEHAAVAVTKNRAGYDQLLGYVTAAGPDGTTLDTAGLRHAVRRQLPDYMVPTAVQQIPDIPLTANGKLDSRALPAPQQETAVSTPRNERERIVADAFKEVLGLDAVGVDDDFFELGGHSLLATRLVALLRDRTGVAPALRTVFEQATVAALAGTLELGANNAHPLKPADRPAVVPLSFAQRRLWFLNRFDPESGAYNIPVVLDLKGTLDVPALYAAINRLAGRHETLRTVFPLIDGEPAQQILPDGERPVELLAVQCSAEGLPGALAAETRRGFDVTRELPLRAVLFQLAPEHHVLAITLHHIAADGWSLAPLAQDLSLAYNALASGADTALAPLPVQYADYTLWQRGELGSEADPTSAISRQLEFWTRELRGAPEELRLPFDFIRGAHSAAGPASSVPLTIRPETSARLNALAREHNASLFMVLQAALAALLTKSGAGEDIPLGTPVAGRTDTQLNELVGFFVNTLVLRTNTSGNPTAAELVESVRYTNLHAYANQDAPFERVVEELNPARSQHRHPLFQVMLTLQNTAAAGLNMNGLDATADLSQEPGGAKFDLLLDLVEAATDEDGPAATGIRGSLAYNPALFARSTVEQLVAGYVAVIEQFAADPGITLDRLRIQSPEQHQLALAHSLSAGAPGSGDFGPETVVDALRATMARTPNAPALVDATGAMSFARLDARVRALAAGLMASGVGPGDRVAVALPRTADVVTAALAVLAAGAVYIPVDLSYPQERIRVILEDGAPAVVISAAPSAADRGTDGPRHLDVGTLLAAGAEVTDADLAQRRPAAGDLAYVLYTSGSTGRPKGVAVPHGALANLYRHHHRTLYVPRFQAAGPDGTVSVAHIAGLGFDAAWDPMLWLIAGAELHIVADEVRSDAESLAGYCRSHGIDVLETTPSYAGQLLHSGLLDPARDQPLLLALGGEAVTAELWTQLASTPEVAAHNFYGPTEFTVDSVTAEISGGSPSIGRGIANTDTFVLDPYLALAPAGVPGELYLAGPGMARGYDRRPAETACRFVANPFAADGSRMYRTGDLVRRAPDGSLEFLSRTDEQVKVRGFRIELGEIEAALASHPQLDRAVAVADGEPAHRVVAYYTGSAGAEDLRELAAGKLPDYMVPSVFMQLSAIPLTPHGKLDRKALPAPSAGTGAGSGAAPETADERTMCGIFADVLGVAEVSMGDDFFVLGGHSLLAVSMMGGIRDAFGTELPLRMLFNEPTPAGLLSAVHRQTGTPGTEASAAAPATAPGSGQREPAAEPVSLTEWLANNDSARNARPELSYAQSRMWFLNQLDPGSADYNISLAVRLTGELDEQALAAAVGALFRRHDVLRTIYPETGGVPEQLVLDPSDATHGAGMHLTVNPPAARDAVPALLRDDAEHGFDVRSELPLRARLIPVRSAGSPEWVLHLVMHHIASDGASLAPLARDLSAAYTAARGQGPAAAPAPLPLQYADYAHWQRQQLDGSALTAKLDHWRRTLAGIPAELMLPADHRRPRESRQPGRQLGFLLGADSVTALNALASASNASLFMALHAALAAFLHRSGAGEDLVIGSPTAGRTDPALRELVGFFVNTLPLRVEAAGDPSLRTMLGRSREGILDAFDHNDVPFERLVEAVNPDRELGRHPLFQTMLTVDTGAPAVPQLPGVRVEAEPETGSGEAKFDLSFTFRPDGGNGGLAGTLDYNAAMFEDATARRLAASFGRFLELAAASPDTPVSLLGLIGTAEAGALMKVTAGSRSDPSAEDPEPGILAAFAATVRATPDAAAVVAADGTLSFAGLAASASRIAAALTGTGVSRGDVVSVLLPRSRATLEGMFGVLAAGAVYNPIDTEYPDERASAIIADAAPPVILTSRSVAARVEQILAGLTVRPRVLVLEDLAAVTEPEKEPGRDTVAAALAAFAVPEPRELAYVIFTSGSTGRPKGVEISHGALAALLGSHRETLLSGLGHRRAAHTTGVGFDASWDPILWMVAGHELHLIDDETRRDAQQLAAYFAAHGINAWETTPGYLRQLLAEPEFTRLLEAHTPGGDEAERFSLALGGEAFDAGLWNTVAAHRGVQAWNLYGPTEATVDTVLARVGGTGEPVLGSPTAGTRLYVLDDRLQHTLPGAAGELYIAGRQLARGYRGRPELTAERFIADPFTGGGERMYRTGDLVFRHADGRLVFAGRNDDQLKIRGFRVEPGEVEQALRSAAGVSAAVVRAVGTDGGTRLIGYVVPAAPGHAADSADGPDAGTLSGEVRDHVRGLLPDYMVPAAVVVIDEVPLTPHGKVDTAALPDPGSTARTAGRGPRTPREKTVAAIFADVLSLDRAGVDESFFELGGHSFLARPLIAKVNAALGTELTVQSLFRAPTVEGLLREASKGAQESAADSLRQLLPLRTTGTKLPLFAVHPASGISWGYASMLGKLDPERPLFGLQMPGMEPGRTHPIEAANLTELADDYIAKLRSVQPAGPYHLMGWSFGGHLVHRLATRLQELGEEVAFLAILDAFPGNQEDNTKVGTGQALWASYLEAQGYELGEQDKAGLDGQRAQEILREHHNPLGSVPLDSVNAMVGNFPPLARLIRQEQPQVFDGDLLFLRATREVPEGTPGTGAWQPFISGTITDVAVDERHSQLLSDRALSAIMPALAIQLGSGPE